MEVEGGIRWLCSARHEPIGLQWKQPDRLVHLKSAGVVLVAYAYYYTKVHRIPLSENEIAAFLGVYGPSNPR